MWAVKYEFHSIGFSLFHLLLSQIHAHTNAQIRFSLNHFPCDGIWSNQTDRIGTGCFDWVFFHSVSLTESILSHDPTKCTCVPVAIRYARLMAVICHQCRSVVTETFVSKNAARNLMLLFQLFALFAITNSMLCFITSKIFISIPNPPTVRSTAR